MTVVTQPLEVLSNRAVGRAPVRELVLMPRDHPIDFLPGQWVSLHLPLTERPPLVRAYSFAEPPRSDGRITLVFDEVEGGLGSTWLAGLTEGATVEAARALGNFTVGSSGGGKPSEPPVLDRDVWMVARFTGIVPARCILMALADAAPSRSVDLVYSAESSAELVFDDQLRELAEKHAWFSYHPCLLGEGDEVEMLDRLLPAGTAYRPMVSGLKALVRPLRGYFVERGFSRREVVCEKYD